MSEKLGLFARTKIFFGEVRTEMDKVVWPTQDQVKTWAIVVFVSTAIVSAILGIWDLGLTKGLTWLFGLNGGGPGAV